MLLSVINLKLRDNYSSFDDLCDDMDEDKNEIMDKLKSSGYTYNPDTNQFILE